VSKELSGEKMKVKSEYRSSPEQSKRGKGKRKKARSSRLGRDRLQRRKELVHRREGV